MQDDHDIAEDLAELEAELEAEEAIQPPPDEPQPPSMDNPPGEHTEYSDTPRDYEVLRLFRSNWTGETAVERFSELAAERGVRLYGDLFWTAKYYCWRAVK